jgi:hypothetical protein
MTATQLPSGLTVITNDPPSPVLIPAGCQEYEAWKKAHAACPKCGGQAREQTTEGYILIAHYDLKLVRLPGPSNRCTCCHCGHTCKWNECVPATAPPRLSLWTE